MEDLRKFQGMEDSTYLGKLESLVRNLRNENDKEMSEINGIWTKTITKNKQQKYVKRIQPCVANSVQKSTKYAKWNFVTTHPFTLKKTIPGA